MFCIECGQELPATAKFCSNCGAKIISAKTPAQQPIWDDIASKAVDIVVMDETPSFNDGGYADDDVRKKAAFFGEGVAPEPQQAVSVRAISTSSTPQKTTVITKPQSKPPTPTKTKKYEKYSYVGEFYNGLARVGLNGKEGFINDRGDEVIPLIYDSVWTFYDGLSKVKLSNKWGFIDKRGKEIIPVKYDEIKTWQDGIAEVSLNGKCGFVNKKGKEVISVIYDSIQSFNDTLFKVELNGKWGIINHAGGEIIPCEYDDIRNDKDDKIIVGLKGLYGIKTIEGYELIPTIFNEIISYENYTATGVIKGKKVYATKAGVIYDKVVDKHQYRTIVSYNNKYGMLNSVGGIVIPLIYDYVRFDNGKYIVVKQDDKYGVFNEGGKEILSIKYDDIELVGNSIKLKIGQLFGIADYNGKWILSIEYDEIWGSNISDIYLVKQNGKFGYVKYSKGKFDIVIHCCLDHAECFHNEQARIEYYNKIYIIDSNFQVYELRPTISTGAICIIFFSIAVFCASITIGKAYYGVGLFLFAFSIIAIAFSLGGLVTKQPCRVNIDVKKWK